MIKKRSEQKVVTEQNSQGIDKLFLHDLSDFEGKNPKIQMFSLARLNPGEEVGFHIHEGEFESYYIISGIGIYDDNGTKSQIMPGCVTFTPSGSGHGIKNTGDSVLEFIALVVKD